MSARDQYRADLRAAVAKVLDGRFEVALATIERELPEHFARPLPGRPTLARAVLALGWHRRPRPGSGVIFCAPAGEARW